MKKTFKEAEKLKITLENLQFFFFCRWLPLSLTCSVRVVDLYFRKRSNLCRRKKKFFIPTLEICCYWYQKGATQIQHIWKISTNGEIFDALLSIFKWHKNWPNDQLRLFYSKKNKSCVVKVFIWTLWRSEILKVFVTKNLKLTVLSRK